MWTRPIGPGKRFRPFPDFSFGKFVEQMLKACDFVKSAGKDESLSNGSRIKFELDHTFLLFSKKLHRVETVSTLLPTFERLSHDIHHVRHLSNERRAKFETVTVNLLHA